MPSYSSTLSSLNRLHPLGIRPGLERIRALLCALGNPERGMRVIHVAGSNGKGSVCRMVEAVLVESGYRTGSFISPHLVDFRERFRIDGQWASKADIAKAYPKLERALKRPEVVKHGPPTFFEAVTALAFLIFKARRCELVVLETGLGGRYDSTNVMARPLVTVITNISLEHTQILGKTEAKIAWEKAGILKRGVPLVTAAEGVALKVIRDVQRQVGGGEVLALKAGKTFKLRSVHQQLVPSVKQSVDIELEGQRRQLSMPLLGAHQRTNLAVALAVLHRLKKHAPRIREASLQAGLAKADWQGRLQLISTAPMTLIDGAHNLAGARALRAALKELKPQRVLLAAGVLKDKDWKGMFRLLAPMAARLYLATPSDARGLDARELKAYLKGFKSAVFASPSLALAAARQAARPGDLVVAAGSLYTVGDLLRSRRSSR